VIHSSHVKIGANEELAEAGRTATIINSIVEQRMLALFNCRVFEVVSTLALLLPVRTVNSSRNFFLHQARLIPFFDLLF
jgi:hypothetical protein